MSRDLATLYEEDERTELAHGHDQCMLIGTPSHYFAGSHQQPAGRPGAKLSPTAEPYQPVGGITASPDKPMSTHYNPAPQTTPPTSSVMAHTNGLLEPFTSPIGQCSSSRAGRPDFMSPQGPSQFVMNATYCPGNGVDYSGPPKFMPAAATSANSSPSTLEPKTADAINNSPPNGVLENGLDPTECQQTMKAMTLQQEFELRALALYQQDQQLKLMNGMGMMATQYKQQPVIGREDILDKVVQEFKAMREERDQGLAREERLSDMVEQLQMELNNLMELAQQNKRDADQNLKNYIRHADQNLQDHTQKLVAEVKDLNGDLDQYLKVTRDYTRICAEADAVKEAWEIEQAKLGKAIRIRDQMIATRNQELATANAELARLRAFQVYAIKNHHVEQRELTHITMSHAAYN